jgi:hypothetical protein
VSTLVVAPNTAALNNLADWVASAQGRPLTVLNGTVTVREVLAAIATGRHRIVHFATHGCATALEVSDGAIPDQLLEDAFRASGTVELVVLGACNSVGIGAALYMAGVPRVLSWRSEVNDVVAGEWARAFYTSLRLSNDIWDATQTAGEAVRRLGKEPPIYLNGRLAVLEAEVKQLRRRATIGGAPAWLLVVLALYAAALLTMLVRMGL